MKLTRNECLDSAMALKLSKNMETNKHQKLVAVNLRIRTCLIVHAQENKVSSVSVVVFRVEIPLSFNELASYITTANNPSRFMQFALSLAR